MNNEDAHNMHTTVENVEMQELISLYNEKLALLESDASGNRLDTTIKQFEQARQEYLTKYKQIMELLDELQEQEDIIRRERVLLIQKLNLLED